MQNKFSYIFDTADSNLISAYDELPLWSAPFGLKLLELLRYKKKMKVLDIGFGTGFPLLEIAMRLGSGSIVYGIDPWKAAFERVRQKIKQYDIKNVNLIEGFAENIPLPNNSIDLVVSNNGINNVADIEKSLNEIARVLKPGSQFVMTMNLNSTMKEFYLIFEKVLKRNSFFDEITKMHEHIYKKRKPLKIIKSYLNSAGFEIDKIYRHKFSYRFLNADSFLSHYFIRLGFASSWYSILNPRDQNKIFKEISDEINKVSEYNGEFKLTVPFAVFDTHLKGKIK